MEEYFKGIISSVGEDINRGGLIETPKRAALAWSEWTSGYSKNAKEILKTFEDGVPTGNEIIFVKEIPMYSHCEHHLAPFFGFCSIGYIPNKTIAGLSKLSRLVDMFSKRLQVQERLTEEIAESLYSIIEAKAVGVRIVARHLCMESRGICKQNSQTTTTATKGWFSGDNNFRKEFMGGVL